MPSKRVYRIDTGSEYTRKSASCSNIVYLRVSSKRSCLCKFAIFQMAEWWNPGGTEPWDMFDSVEDYENYICHDSDDSNDDESSSDGCGSSPHPIRGKIILAYCT